MRSSNKAISETTLATNLNELAHGFVRELAMACRKVSIYGSAHPIGRKAVDKPFFVLDRIFLFKNHVNLNLHQGVLYALNIQLKQNLLTKEITRYMQVLDVEAILFSRWVTMMEFDGFIGRLVKRVNLSSHQNLLSTYLEKTGVTTIEVNSKAAFKLFESQKKYSGEACGDFSVRNLALQQLGDSLEALVDVDCRGQAALDERGIDFTLDLIRYLLPERFATLPSESVIERLIDLARQMETVSGDEKKKSLLDNYKALHELVDYHSQRDSIISTLEQYLSTSKLPAETTRELSTSVGAIRVASCEHIDTLFKQLFVSENYAYCSEEYCQAFQRLLKTGQRTKATDTTLRLMGLLTAPDGGTRQRALQLLVSSLMPLDFDTDSDVFEIAVDRVMADLAQKKETFEYSEVIRCLLGKFLVARRFDLMARLTGAMAKRRRFDGDVILYDSMAVRKAFESLNRCEVVDALIDNMVKADHESSNHIREILVSMCSEEVAVALSQIISYPVRQVRQQSLKVLAELGKASLKVFSRILMDDAMFEREKGRDELPDSRWYVVRNSIFVLGSLGDSDGVIALRLRMNDRDVRVRREIVSALEKIGGEDACDLLVLMAEDAAEEIRESAVIGLGLIGTPDMAPLLLDLARRNPSVAVRAVRALGKIGGEMARSSLIKLLEDDRKLSELALGPVSKEEIQLAAVKSLGEIGDEKSIDALKEYKNNLATVQKILFKVSPIRRAIANILSRH